VTAPGPIDTIREALNLLHIGHQNERLPEEPPCPYCDRREAALAALTEVEHQLEAGLPILSIDGRYVLTSKWAKEQARAVAAETALAEWREIAEAFLDAWWEWEPGTNTEPLDQAASRAMSLRGDVIRLAGEDSLA